MLAGMTLVPLLFLLVVLRLLPWLGREGDFNQLVEDAIQSVLSVPIQIGNIDTEPFSEFSITRIKSLSLEARDRLQFQVKRLTVFYNPLELIFESRVRELVARGPSLHMNLDEDLSGIIRLPPQGSGEAEAPGYLVDRFRIADGRLAIRIGGNELVFENLELDATGLGGNGKIGFQASGRGLGARISVTGNLVPLREPPGGPGRYRIQIALLEVEDLNLEPLLSFLVPPGVLKGGGVLSLSGKAWGIWPERVETRLTSRFRDTRMVRAGAPRLQDGEGLLELNAIAHGRLDRVDFQIRFNAGLEVEEGGDSIRPFREEVSLFSSGRFEKKGEAGRLSLEKIQVEVPGLGRSTGRGSVELGDGEPEFSLNLQLPRVTLEKLRGHAIGGTLRGILGFAGGDLALEIQAGGTAHRPDLTVEFDIQEGVLKSGENSWLTASLKGGARFQGVLDLVRLVEGRGPGLIGGELDVQVSRGSLSIPGAELEIPEFSAGGTSRLTGDPRVELGIQLQAHLTAPEIGVGLVVETAADDPVELRGDLYLRPLESGGGAGTSVRGDVLLETRSTGPISLRGTLSHGEGGAPAADLEVRADSIPNANFLGTFLRDPLQAKVEILQGARFTGRSTLEGRLRSSHGETLLSGEIRTPGLGATLGEVQLERIWFSIPFRIGDVPGQCDPGDLPGFLQIGRLAYRNLDLRRIWLPFSYSGGAYRLSNPPIPVPLLGGTLNLNRLEILPPDSPKRLRLAFDARDLDLGELTRLLELPETPGRAVFQARSLAMDGERLEIDGHLKLQLFGGSLELGGLSVEHPFSPYRTYFLESGRLRDLDLESLGNHYRFGIASGVLEGWLKNLEIQGTELVGFQAGVETVPRPGVSQYLNKDAIESIQQILFGPFRGIERAFFSKFRYAGFGFNCSLKEGDFRLRGKYHFGDTEYLMYSKWYQFPKVSIINTNPDIAYDWERIVDNLKNISGPPEVSNEGGE